MMMMESCIFCEYQLDPQDGNPGNTSNSLKTLFQFLNVNVGGRSRSTTSSSSVPVFVVEEEEVGWIASKICEDCAIVANGFGAMAESFDKALQNFLKQWIRKLASRSNNKNNNKSPDATTSTIPSASPGDGLRAEILKKWELKLNPYKPNEEELPCEQQDGGGGGGNVLEAEEGGRMRHQSEVVAGEVVMMMLPQTSNYSALGDAAADDNNIIQKASEERPTITNQVNGGNEEPVVVAPTKEWRTLIPCKTSSDDAQQIQSENTTFSGEIRPSDVASRLPDGRLLQSNDLPQPPIITSLPMPTSTTTPTPFTKSRTCPYPNCGIPFRGPKASEKKHYTCVHTVEHFPDQFLGFSQKDVNELTRDICSQEFSQNLEEPNTFKCPFCAPSSSSGIKEADKKFHLLLEHSEVVKSRLEARRTVVATINANNNHLDEPTNVMNGPQMHNNDLPIVREEHGEHDDDVVGEDGGMDEQLEEQEGQADEMEEEVEQSDDEMEQGQREEMEEEHDECHDDMDEDQLHDDEEDDDGGAQEDEASVDWDDSNLEQEEDDGPPKLQIPYFTCGYCDLRLYGHHADLVRHMICNHTVAYFTRRGKLPGSTSEEDMDRVILGLRQQGLLSHPDKQDTFRCSFCHQYIVRVDKKYHLLEEHLDLIQSRLKEMKKVKEVVEQPPPPPPAAPRTRTPSQLVSIKREAAEGESTPAPPPSPPEVEELETTQTEEMLRRQNDKADFYRNREAFKSDPSKPRFNYIFLIKLAIADSPDHQLKAREICSWIKSSFGYYRRNKNPKIAETLKIGIAQTLSHNECFVKHKVEGNEGVWRVDFKAFYKDGRKLSRRPAESSTFGTTSSALTTTVNVKREVLEGDLINMQQSSSTRNEQPPQAGLLVGSITTSQVERAAGGSRNDNEMGVENRGRLRAQGSTKMGGQCDFCDGWISGPKPNLERHMMCVHSARYFSQHLLRRPGTISQQDLNNAVAELCKQVIDSSGNQKRFHFYCSLCRAAKTGDKKYHLFKQHFSKVLSRVEGSGGSSSGGVPNPTANTFDEDLASPDLLTHMHIKQERK